MVRRLASFLKKIALETLRVSVRVVIFQFVFERKKILANKSVNAHLYKV